MFAASPHRRAPFSSGCATCFEIACLAALPVVTCFRFNRYRPAAMRLRLPWKDRPKVTTEILHRRSHGDRYKTVMPVCGQLCSARRLGP